MADIKNKTQFELEYGLGASNVTDYAAVTPSDTTTFANKAIGICVTGTAGDVAVRKPNNSIAIIPAAMLPVGQIIPLPAIQIRATSTTATGIWVVY